MHWNLRTYLRLFLLIGGALFFVTGLRGGETVEMAIGAVAVGLGGVGLVSEWRETAV